MRVGIDGRNLFLARGTGIRSYAEALAEACRRLGHDVVVVGRHDGVADPSPFAALRRLGCAFATGSARLTAGGEADPVLDLFRTAHVRFGLRHEATVVEFDRAVDLMHWSCPLPLVAAGVPNVLTIHDLIPLTHPSLTGNGGARSRRLLDAVLPRMDHVLTVSDAVRRDVLRVFGLDPERVTTIGEAVEIPDALRREIEAQDPICPAGAFVAVGLVERRKNVGRLIEAHSRSGVAAPLVLIGPDGDGAADELAPTARHRLGPGGVRRIGWASRPALLRAVRDARALLFPSLAEGFGLPIVEAMALGTPVLTSEGGATEETAGSAALLVDPTDTDAIADGIRRLDRDAAFRRRLVEAGRRRAADFTTDRFARNLSCVEDRVLRPPGARSRLSAATMRKEEWQEA